MLPMETPHCQQLLRQNDKILEKGMAVHACTTRRYSPLRVACAAGFEDIVLFLFEKVADIMLCNTDGTNALYLACYNHHDGITKIFSRKACKY